MSSALSIVFAAVGAVAAAGGAATLLARCFRGPRPDLIAWSVALLALLVSIGAQLLGYLGGYDQDIFRAMAIGGLVIAPLAVVLGLTEIASRGLAARFCARLYISALAIVAVVILVLDQLGSTTFTKAWPDPHKYYQSPPNYMLYVTSVVTIIIAAIAAGVVMTRSKDRDWSQASTPQVAAGVVALLLAYPGIALLARNEAKQSLPLSSVFTPLQAVAAGLLVYAALKLSDQDLAALHRRAGASGDRSGATEGRPGAGSRDGASAGSGRPDGSWRRDGQLADEGRYAGEFDRYDRGDGYGDLYRPPPVPETARPGRARPDDDPYAYDRGDRGQYGEDYDRYGADSADADFHTGDFQTGDFDAVPPAAAAAAMAASALGDAPGRAASTGRAAGPGPVTDPAEASRQDLFGQIAIYTLLEDRVAEFDQLTERVVEDVRGREPDTLVFIVHAVPSAPMQRILYEVYRDRAAYEWHRQQPYVTRFEADRRPYVLATNVIELGLQQAKVTPFPSVAELFGEPGFDTSGFERPDYLRDYGRPPAREGGERW